MRATGLSKVRGQGGAITCCASGSRSETARRILAAAGFGEVHNGGSWRGLRKSLR